MDNPSVPYLQDPSGREHLLLESLTRIGRDVENEIVVMSKRASREHAHILREGRRVLLQDNDSTNGTYLNGERLQTRTLLRDGDRIGVGQIKFLIHVPETTTHETPF